MASAPPPAPSSLIPQGNPVLPQNQYTNHPNWKHSRKPSAPGQIYTLIKIPVLLMNISPLLSVHTALHPPTSPPSIKNSLAHWKHSAEQPSISPQVRHPRAYQNPGKGGRTQDFQPFCASPFPSSPHGKLCSFPLSARLEPVLPSKDPNRAA